MEPFSDKESMERLGFLSKMTENFNSKRLREDLASLVIGLFLSGSRQTVYTNVGHPKTQDATRLQVTWPLIVHLLLNRFIVDYFLHNEHYAVNFARIEKRETEIYVAERLHGRHGPPLPKRFL